MKVGVINYGMGNLRSVLRALKEIGATAMILSTPQEINEVDRIVLPGVGAFAEAMARLRSENWCTAIHEAVLENHKPLLGICLGMQMLASTSEEGGHHIGLDLVQGQVQHLSKLGCDLRIPHVGWNEVLQHREDPFMSGIANHSDFYFVHSFALKPEDQQTVLAVTDYQVPITAIVRQGIVLGTQFHPEKSSKVGRQLLTNFLKL